LTLNQTSPAFDFSFRLTFLCVYNQPTNQLTNHNLCQFNSIQTFVGSFNTSVEWLLCFLISRKFISLCIWLIWLLINFNQYWLLRLEVGRRPTETATKRPLDSTWTLVVSTSALTCDLFNYQLSVNFIWFFKIKSEFCFVDISVRFGLVWFGETVRNSYKPQIVCCYLQMCFGDFQDFDWQSLNSQTHKDWFSWIFGWLSISISSKVYQ